MKTIRIFTHGSKQKGPDPHMTADGTHQLVSLAMFLPKNISEVWAGEASRHEDVASALGLADHPNRWWTAAFGAAGSLEVVDGQKMLVLPSGKMVPFDRTTSAYDGGPAVRAKLAALSNNSVVCAGREIIVALGETVDTAKSAAVYEVEVADDGTISYKLLATAS